VVLHAVKCQQVEHALSPIPVDNLSQVIVLLHQQGVGTDENQFGSRPVFAEVVAQVSEGLTDRLEFDTSVEQRLDELELQQVSVAVAPAAAATGSIGNRGAYQVGTSEVVQLPVADAHDVSGLAATERLDHWGPGRCGSDLSRLGGADRAPRCG
jgi:hypothetical protein